MLHEAILSWSPRFFFLISKFVRHLPIELLIGWRQFSQVEANCSSPEPDYHTKGSYTRSEAKSRSYPNKIRTTEHLNEFLGYTNWHQGCEKK